MAGAALVIGKILQGAGTSLGLYGQYKQGLAGAKRQAFDSQIAANNAELASQDIDVREAGGREERANIDKAGAVQRGEACVGFAGGNVALDDGSALDVDIAFAEQAARDRRASKDQEAVDVKRLQVEKDSLLAESRLLRKAAKTSRKSAKLGFIGGNLSAIGSSMSK